MRPVALGQISPFPFPDIQNIIIVPWILFGISAACNLVLAVFVILLCRRHGCHIAGTQRDSHSDRDVAVHGTAVMQSLPKTGTGVDYEPVGDMVSASLFFSESAYELISCHYVNICIAIELSY